MVLYNFDKLSSVLDKFNYPPAKSGGGFQLIKGVDFKRAFENGKIHFEDDGIYLEFQGKKHKGYMFIQHAFITYNGGPVRLPVFHTMKCETIQEFLDSGRFNQRFEFSNSTTNNLIDRQTGVGYNDQNLRICSFCNQISLDNIGTTEDFYNALDKEELKEEVVEVDINGYVKGWDRLSEKYKEGKEYTCEVCSLTPKNNMHKRWWHTHHVDGVKINNHLDNLQCLCISCHSQVDARHAENFRRKSNSLALEAFNSEY
jgi:hypothetical protein